MRGRGALLLFLEEIIVYRRFWKVSQILFWKDGSRVALGLQRAAKWTFHGAIPIDLGTSFGKCPYITALE